MAQRVMAAPLGPPLRLPPHVRKIAHTFTAPAGNPHDSFMDVPLNPPDVLAAALTVDANAPDALSALVELALARAKAILAIRLDRDHPNYAYELRAMTALINTALTTQVRVDENMMKAAADPERIKRMLEEVRAVKADAPWLPKRQT